MGLPLVTKNSRDDLELQGQDLQSEHFLLGKLTARSKTSSFVAAEVTRLKFPCKQSFIQSLLTSAATSLTGFQLVTGLGSQMCVTTPPSISTSLSSLVRIWAPTPLQTDHAAGSRADWQAGCLPPQWRHASQRASDGGFQPPVRCGCQGRVAQKGFRNTDQAEVSCVLESLRDQGARTGLVPGTRRHLRLAAKMNPLSARAFQTRPPAPAPAGCARSGWSRSDGPGFVAATTVATALA